jgi:cytochrome c551/c552
MNWKNRDAIWIYVFAFILLAITGVIYRKQYGPEWKKYQSEFKELVTRRLGPDRAARLPTNLQQVWVKDLNRVDRCVTCHQGAEWNGFDDAPEPFRSHPKTILEKHPIAKYGCTICHGGQGFATDARSAHATMIEHWEEPLLSTELGNAYKLKDPKALIQINCNVCHRNDTETKGAEYINTAKALAEEVGCDSCHRINGRGKVVGPELTYVGDQSAEHFDFSRIPNVKSVFGWHVAHFANPEAVAGQTVMPDLSLDKSDAQALALLVMSWKRVNLPIAYIHGSAERQQVAANNAAQEPRQKQ